MHSITMMVMVQWTNQSALSFKRELPTHFVALPFPFFSFPFPPIRPIPIPHPSQPHPQPQSPTPPSLSPSPVLHPHLTPNKRKNHHTGPPKHLHALDQGEGELPYRRRVRDGGGSAELKPDGEESDGEEVVEESEGLADDAGEEAGGGVDAGAAALEVAEAAELEGAEGGVWDLGGGRS